MEDLNALEEIYGEVSVWVQNLSEHKWERGFLEKLREGVLAYHSSKNTHPLFADSLKQLVDGVDYSAYGTELFETEWQYMMPFANQAFYWLDKLGSTEVISVSRNTKTVQFVDWTDFCTYLGCIFSDTDTAIERFEKARSVRKGLRGSWKFCCASALADEYLRCGQLQKAVELYEVCIECKRLSTRGDFLVEMSRASVMLLAGNKEKAKEIINSSIQRAGEVLPLDWELKAYLLARAGEIKSSSGDYEDSVADQELALKVCVENKFKFTDPPVLERMVICFSQLIRDLANSCGDMVSAWKVYGLVAPFVKNQQLSEYAMSTWEMAEVEVWLLVGNLQSIHEKARREAEGLLEGEFKVSNVEAEDQAYEALVAKVFPSLNLNRSKKRMLQRAKLQVMHGNINEGFQALDDLEKMENNKGGSLTSALLHLDRASYLIHHNYEMDLALQELDKVKNIFEQMLFAKSPFKEKIHRLRLYQLRYEAEWHLGNLPGCLLLLDKVQELFPASAYSLRAWVHHHRACVLSKMRRFSDAATEAQIAASLCMTLQSQFGQEEKEDPEVVWVSILSGTLIKACLQLNEFLSFGMQDARRGLIWAERCAST